MPVLCQLATGGTAAANGSRVSPCGYKYRNSETHLLNAALRRAHAAAGALGKQKRAHLNASQTHEIHRPGAEAPLLQEPAGGVFPQRSTVVAAKPRSSTSHSW
jgi:hypothetical protein